MESRSINVQIDIYPISVYVSMVVIVFFLSPREETRTAYWCPSLGRAKIQRAVLPHSLETGIELT